MTRALTAEPFDASLKPTNQCVNSSSRVLCKYPRIDNHFKELTYPPQSSEYKTEALDGSSDNIMKLKACAAFGMK